MIVLWLSSSYKTGVISPLTWSSEVIHTLLCQNKSNKDDLSIIPTLQVSNGELTLILNETGFRSLQNTLHYKLIK